MNGIACAQQEPFWLRPRLSWYCPTYWHMRSFVFHPLPSGMTTLKQPGPSIATQVPPPALKSPHRGGKSPQRGGQISFCLWPGCPQRSCGGKGRWHGASHALSAAPLVCWDIMPACPLVPRECHCPARTWSCWWRCGKMGTTGDEWWWRCCDSHPSGPGVRGVTVT